MDGNGREGIFFRTRYHIASLIDADGQRPWADEAYHDFWRAGPVHQAMFLEDIDDDGHLELVTGDSNGTVHALDTTCGSAKWRQQVGESIVDMTWLPHQRRVLVLDRLGYLTWLDGFGKRQDQRMQSKELCMD